MPDHVYITGGASGIGRELAKRFVADGHHVVLFDRQACDATINELLGFRRSQTQNIRGYSLDVADADAAVKVFAEAAVLAPPDVVVHCAGITSAKAFVDLSHEEFTRVITINLIGSRNIAAAALPHLRAGSQLVLIASMAGLVGCYGYSAYCAAKHGVVGLAQVLRIELKLKGIEVCVVCPPEVDTPMVQHERTFRPKATEAMKLLAGSLSVDDACAQIYAGIRARNFLIIPGKKARVLWLMQNMAPGFITRMVSDFIAARAS